MHLGIGHPAPTVLAKREGPTASRHFKLDRQRGCSCQISLFLGHLASVSHPVLAMDCRFPSKASVSLISPSSEPARVCSGIYPAPRRPSLSDGQTPLGASCKTWRSTPDPSLPSAFLTLTGSLDRAERAVIAMLVVSHVYQSISAT